jgi:hypothetical protein
MEVGGTTGSSAKEWGFQPIHNMIKNNYTTLQVISHHGEVELHRKHSTKCETVAKIQDKQVTQIME